MESEIQKSSRKIFSARKETRKFYSRRRIFQYRICQKAL